MNMFELFKHGPQVIIKLTKDRLQVIFKLTKLRSALIEHFSIGKIQSYETGAIARRSMNGFSITESANFDEYPQSMFWAEIWKISEFFIWKFSGFWRWKFLYIRIGVFS